MLWDVLGFPGMLWNSLGCPRILCSGTFFPAQHSSHTHPSLPGAFPLCHPIRGVSPGLSLLSLSPVPVREGGTDGWYWVQTPLAQRLMMQESSLAQFALQSAASLPAITLGLPATTSTRVGASGLYPHPVGFSLGFGVPGAAHRHGGENSGFEFPQDSAPMAK